MNVTEKAAYIKGLVQGLQIDETKAENKVLMAIIDLLDDVALELSELQESHNDLFDQVYAIDEDLCTLEEDFYDEEPEEDEDEASYEVTCPNCKNTTYFSEHDLIKSQITCPNCGEQLKCDFNDCGCGYQGCNCDETDQTEE